MVVHALSIDLEEWFQAELIRQRLCEERPQRRVTWAVEPFLHLLERYGVRATFFVVGDVLRHEPELVQRLHGAGHEIGCHGWSHRPLWQLEPGRFAWELDEFDRAAAKVLPSREVIGFRAPTFSLDASTAWALDLLAERGYRYDSSIFPLRTALYGVADAPRRVYHVHSRDLTQPSRDGALMEFPMTVANVGGFDIPVAGGVYLRALPLAALAYLLHREDDAGRPFVLYVHPWEADLETPRVSRLPWLARVATYYNRRSTLAKLEELLRRFRFAPLCDVLGLTGERRRRVLAGDGIA